MFRELSCKRSNPYQTEIIANKAPTMPINKEIDENEIAWYQTLYHSILNIINGLSASTRDVTLDIPELVAYLICRPNYDVWA